MAESSPREPTFVLGPLTLVAVVALWRGITRREPVAATVGVTAAAAELGWPAYRGFKRRWTLFSYYRDA